MKSFLERLELGETVLKFTKRVITAFFSGLASFLIFLIFAGFGLAIAYIAHLIVNIGSVHPEKFSVPEWLKKFEPWSVGLFILALLALAAAEPWKDAYRYFRYGTVELEQSAENEEGESERAEGSEAAELTENASIDQAVEEAQTAEEVHPVPGSITEPIKKTLAGTPARRGRGNRKNPPGKRH